MLFKTAFYPLLQQSSKQQEKLYAIGLYSNDFSQSLCIKLDEKGNNLYTSNRLGVKLVH